VGGQILVCHGQIVLNGAYFGDTLFIGFSYSIRPEGAGAAPRGRRAISRGVYCSSVIVEWRSSNNDR
jgi:hypothetical protein